MDYQDIEIFLTIVATKSITKAADILFLSQPTVSHRLNLLENSLEVPLVIRKKGHKTIQLTNKGEEFVAIAQRWIALMKETKALKENQESFYVTLGVTDSLNVAFLAPFYSRLLEGSLPLDIRIQTHHSSELYNLLENHEIDMAFVYHNLHYKNVITEEIFREELYLIQSDPPVINKEKIHTKELDPNQEIFLSWDNNYQIWHDQWITRMPRPRISIDTISLASRLWMQRNYWMIAPVSVIQEFCKTRPFYISKIENKPPDRICYKVTHKSRDPKINKSIKYVEEMLDKFIAERKFQIPFGRYYIGNCKK